VKDIVLGNQMADCPILIVEDREKEVTALSHCGASYINRMLPVDTVKALIKEFNSNIDDLYVYVGSCAKKENYIYDKYPFWATDEKVWKDLIIEKEDGFHIDMNGAIRKQLEQIGIKHIEESPIDTITDNRYYSHRAASMGKKEKLGQNFVGFYYKQKEK
jgi:copper oxidase (laccase) domain-containing protein